MAETTVQDKLAEAGATAIRQAVGQTAAMAAQRFEHFAGQFGEDVIEAALGGSKDFNAARAALQRIAQLAIPNFDARRARSSRAAPTQPTA